jgi:hypothetical protein
MRQISSTETKPLSFKKTIGQLSQKTIAHGEKIAWIHSHSKDPGASFDLIIRDGGGMIKFQRKDCSTETTEFGELVNLETRPGEVMTVEIENLKGVDDVDIFLN